MFLRALRNIRHTLALRLTLWYAGIFVVSSFLCFALVYVLIVSFIEGRTDDDLVSDVEEFAIFLESGGLERVIKQIEFDTYGDEANNVFYRLWTPDGRLIETDRSDWEGLELPRDALQTLEQTGEPILETLSLPQRDDKVRAIIGLLAPGYILQTGESQDDNEELINTILQGFLSTLVTVILLGVPIGWFMARRALRGVQEITRTATSIAQGELDRRVVVGSRGDELDTLARAFNTMLDRIQALILGMRQMTDNLAHDLRSPLGRIRASAEMASASAGARDDYETMVATTTEECDRLLEIINTTLDIAEAESGAVKLNVTHVDLVDLVRDAAEIFHSSAEDKQITIAVESQDHCRIIGDLQRLQRTVANLLDNAVKYTPEGGRVTIKLVEKNGRVELSVEDTGIGISAQEAGRIFERFYRCDSSRTEQGNRLGLSLALAFARAHGGEIVVHSIPGQGSVFTTVLPRSEANSLPGPHDEPSSRIQPPVHEQHPRPVG